MGGQRAANRQAIRRSVAGIAAEQHGVISRTQLLAEGVGSRAIEEWIASARLHRLRRGVYAVGHRSIDAEGTWMGAVLGLGPNSLLGYRSAGALLALRPSASPRIEIIVRAKGGRPRTDRDLLVRRSTTLRDKDITRVAGIPVTTAARTLLDLAAVLPPAGIRRALERAEVLRLFDLHEIQDVLAANPRARGRATLARLLEEQAATNVSRSDLEGAFLELCAGIGLPTPLVNATVEGYEVDFLWRDATLIVEVDSHRYHRTSAAFERDRGRDQVLIAAGYAVLRFTDRQINGSPGKVVATVERVLAGRLSGRI